MPTITPEYLAQIQRLTRENEALKAQLQAIESAKNRHSASVSEAPAFLARAEFIREVARMAAHDLRYGGASSMLSMCFEGLEASAAHMPSAHHADIISTIANTLTAHVRACDIIGRTGTEDFAVYLTRCNRIDAEKKASVLVAALQEKLAPLLEHTARVELAYVVKNIGDDN